MHDAIEVRDDCRCVYCGDYASEVDHVVPRSLGGPSIRSNLVMCCMPCNRQKNNSLEFKWLYLAFRHLLTKGESLAWLDVYSAANGFSVLAHGLNFARENVVRSGGAKTTTVTIPEPDEMSELVPCGNCGELFELGQSDYINWCMVCHV